MHENAAGNQANEAVKPAPPLQFTATLLPHRSLSRKGFIALMTAVGAIGFVGGAVFIMMGAWPVTGFFGLDVLLIYMAFRLNYRAARSIEKVDLTESELRITRISPSGKTRSWTFNPYWVRLKLTSYENAADELYLSSHGKRLVLGAFLSDGEKAAFAAALGDALAAQKSAGKG